MDIYYQYTDSLGDNTMTITKQEFIKSVKISTNILTSDKDIVDAKQILGKLALNFTDEDIKEIVSEIHYLAETWLDDFERKMFDGHTLKELIFEEKKP
jgi:NH3-dependent NAD+ synthetase